MSTWTYNWKMFFNPDSSKLAQEMLFSKKKKKEFKFIQPLASAMFMLRECLIKSIYNPRKNVWDKIEKSSKIGQDKKSWISPFRCFLTGTAKIRFLKGRLGTRPNLRFS